MKRILTGLAALFLLPAAFAGESALVHTFQPMDGLGGGGIEIESVACYVHSAESGLPNSIYLISAANRPPTLSEHPAEDLNLASVYRIYFTGGDSSGGDTSITLDTSRMKAASEVPSTPDYGKEKVIRACLECLRRSLPERIAKFPLKLTCKDSDRNWLEPIVKEFNEHDRSKVFFNDEG